MKEEPEEPVDLSGYDDIFEHYIKNQMVDASPKTRHNYTTAADAFRDFLAQEELTIEDIGKREAHEFAEFLFNKENEKNTALRYLSKIDIMVSHYNDIGYLGWNPIAIEADKYEREPTDSTRREVSLEKLRELLADVLNSEDPILFVIMMVLLKTGVRRSELANLDLRDIHLNHPIQRLMPDPRPELRSSPDTLFIDATVKDGEEYHHDIREGGNKRAKSVPIPIDDELKQVLIWWIAMLPPARSESKPLLRNTQKRTGKRPQPATIYDKIRNWAKKENLHEGRGGLNVDVHWFRHYFTDHMRQEVTRDDLEEKKEPKYYVKGLRGDSGDDVIDIYTHDWGKNDWKRKAYLDNIYKLLV
jgi:integrase